MRMNDQQVETDRSMRRTQSALTRSRVSGWGLLICLAGACLAGCQTPPDVKPFAVATDALDVVVRSVGREIGNELKTRATAEDVENDKWAELEVDFRTAWSHRIAALDAVSAYAAGLVQVVDAGRSGEQSAREVLDGANTLVSSFSSAYPGGSAAVELLTDALVKSYGVFAQDYAARSVADAIEHVNPAVEDLAGILASDFAVLEQLINDHRNDDLLALAAEYQSNERRDLAAMNSIADARAKARDAAALASDPEEFEELRVIAEGWHKLYEQEAAAEWYAEMTERKAAIIRKHDSRRDAVRSAAATVQAWGEAHESLARASTTMQTPSFAVLAQLTTELLESYAEMRSND